MPLTWRTDFRSPNFSARDGETVSLLVLHYTGMQTAHAALTRLCEEQAKVSAHYVVDEEGGIFQLVGEKHCAWHAGVSFWRGVRNVNRSSIGIEIVNPGHEWGYRHFPEVQMQAVAMLCRDILSRHAIAARDIVAHSDIAPQRKEDPGELFDWQWLAEQGVGLWPEAGKEEAGKAGSWKLKLGDSGQEVQALQQALARWGYETSQEGHFDALTQKVAIAFQRHFRPSNIDGGWDEQCAGRLAALLSRI